MEEIKKIGSICEEIVFSDFFRSHAKTLRNYLLYKFGNEEQANDMCQEAFVKLWENCANVPVGKARSFLYTVANNATLNQIAHQKVVLNYVKKESSSQHTNESPEFILEEEQFKKKLERAIQNLSESQRTAFLLNRIDGKKYSEIAILLDISVKAVEKRIHGALVSLRQEIENIK
ncbi:MULTISPECIES: RNA polymerase sigma factor [Flavobacterium]|jgi:RNA polymerase sigma-70 factor (family 1)|uniref:RNA polymerase sigma-70 factor (ECF subfamily) n=1 Tax=Flavobacterium lindanitolerans TaxID=428988 RepID=A0A497UV17_9FLAO|nr:MULTISPECIES: sigma-70 family RNA polymerase sigma factor [Flavobacterium]MBU7571073.1 sigma-70 family RNA polymerase sigma factor [Flavobacterium sp.]PZO31172.1 MAG: RNA polymerase subunit sigma-70 [Flavobacteriaceae bacterium]PZQ80419.1 MAG: RNA polymerase subunit sigma-70 [Flavobacterium johnsoniae]KQS47317.1 RNA polymerase subunit sigma-70 [Flavobacterium sp. Leaf359]MBL7869691.1 sigma-70 family RNA polymerase sigma factor [Flavobacterium lindanitolerans]